ncbi:hypothetical protein [Listeria sp. ILCC797]|uniref:hypothetical protein n=1 Tax=Listeria sp. ILCC797 TaxID=1918333 RepID=UPI000B596947|nr:hypothetical protein [Listeria sp. ILCC797]
MRQKRKSKIRERYRYLFVILIMLLIGILFIVSVSSVMLSISLSMSDNVFSLQALGDWIISIAWLLSAALTIWTIYRNIKKRALDRKTIPLILAFFNLAILISSLIPLFILNERATVEGVEKVMLNTEIFYYTSVGCLLLTFACTIYMLRKQISERSNWYVFMTSIPYLMIGWVIQRGYTAFHDFQQAGNYQDTAAMLTDVSQYPFILNKTWFTFLALVLFNFILILGVNLLEFIWHQTEAYRKGRSRKKAKTTKE